MRNCPTLNNNIKQCCPTAVSTAIYLKLTATSGLKTAHIYTHIVLSFFSLIISHSLAIKAEIILHYIISLQRADGAQSLNAA